MNTLELAKKLKNGEVAPFYIVRGDDAYFLTSALNLFKNVIEEEGRFLNYFAYDEAPQVAELVGECKTPPMLAERRVIVVREWTEKLSEQDAARLVDYFAYPMETTLLVIMDVAKKLTRLDKYAQVVDCGRIGDADLQNWIRIRAAQNGLRIEASAAQRLIDFTKGNMARISTETDKLCAYSVGTITERDVENLVTPELDTQIYELANVLLRGEGAAAWELLDDMFRLNYGEDQILGNLTTQYRRIFYAKASPLSDDELSGWLGVKPYAVKKSRETAARYSVGVLKKCLMLLEEQGVALRTENLDKRALLYGCVLKLAVAGRTAQ